MVFGMQYSIYTIFYSIHTIFLQYFTIFFTVFYNIFYSIHTILTQLVDDNYELSLKTKQHRKEDFFLFCFSMLGKINVHSRQGLFIQINQFQVL